MDLCLDPATHDLLLTDAGDVRLTSGIPEAAAQRLTITLALFLGEWFLDTTAGVPYFQTLFRDVPDESVIRTIFRQRIEADPYVVAVTSLSITIDRGARTLAIDFTAQLIEGGELQVILTESLLDGQVVINTAGLYLNGIPITVT